MKLKEIILILNNSQSSYKTLIAAAEVRGVPLSVVVEGAKEIFDLYEFELIIIRPDQYVAWRGNKLPDDPMQLIDMVIGN